MLTVDVTRTFDFDSEPYKALYDSADATAFQHPDWHSAMQKLIAQRPELEPKILTFREEESGALVGLVPLVLRKKLGLKILEYANLDLVDYALPTLAPNFPQLADATPDLAKKIKNALGGYDILRIKHMPIETSMLQPLFPGSFLVRADFSAHAAKLPDNYEDWRSVAISRKEAKHRDRKRKALLKRGEWRIHCLKEPEEVAIAFAKMRTFRAPRYADRPGDDMMQLPLTFDFYVKLAQEGAKTGFARSYQFTLDDEIVAVQFGIVDKKRYLYLLMGINYDVIGRHSPGLLMCEDIAADCIKQGYEVFDLTVGDEPYKFKFGTEPIAINTLWQARSLLGRIGLKAAFLLKSSKLANRIRTLLKRH